MVGTQPSQREVTGGVDTHADTHTVAALDELGRLIGHETFPATSVGYDQLLCWLPRHGESSRSVSREQAPTAPA